VPTGGTAAAASCAAAGRSTHRATRLCPPPAHSAPVSAAHRQPLRRRQSPPIAPLYLQPASAYPPATVAGRGAVRAKKAREHVARIGSERRFIGPQGPPWRATKFEAFLGTPQLEQAASPPPPAKKSTGQKIRGLWISRGAGRQGTGLMPLGADAPAGRRADARLPSSLSL